MLNKDKEKIKTRNYRFSKDLSLLEKCEFINI